MNICRRARVIATFSFRSMSAPFASVVVTDRISIIDGVEIVVPYNIMSRCEPWNLSTVSMIIFSLSGIFRRAISLVTIAIWLRKGTIIPISLFGLHFMLFFLHSL